MIRMEPSFFTYGFILNHVVFRKDTIIDDTSSVSLQMSLVAGKPVFGGSQATQPHKLARGLKFRINRVEGLY